MKVLLFVFLVSWVAVAEETPTVENLQERVTKLREEMKNYASSDYARMNLQEKFDELQGDFNRLGVNSDFPGYSDLSDGLNSLRAVFEPPQQSHGGTSTSMPPLGTASSNPPAGEPTGLPGGTGLPGAPALPVTGVAQEAPNPVMTAQIAQAANQVASNPALGSPCGGAAAGAAAGCKGGCPGAGGGGAGGKGSGGSGSGGSSGSGGGSSLANAFGQGQQQSGGSSNKDSNQQSNQPTTYATIKLDGQNNILSQLLNSRQQDDNSNFAQLFATLMQNFQVGSGAARGIAASFPSAQDLAIQLNGNPNDKL